MAARRQPWMKWYPTDWRADPRLRMCSLAARGLWIELIGYMHESPRYGYLLISEAVPTAKQLAILVGSSPAVVEACFDELRAAGVFSLDAGIPYSRRMVRDREQAIIDRENGKNGGNPQLRRPVNGSDNGGVNPPFKVVVGSGDKAQKLD